MDAQQIRRLKPKLDRYLKRFTDGFVRKDTHGHFPVYVQGQLSELHRKSVEPIAKQAGVPVRTLQEFLSLLKWDEERMRDRLQAIVAAEHASPRAVGVIDESSFAQQGEKTPGVKRQYCGRTGKTEKCIVTVHLGYAAEGFHCLLDGELFLPEDWHQDRERCRRAGIPEEVVYRPKWKIALELLDRARQNGVPGPRLRLVIARNVLNPNEIKFFLADAPPGTSVGTLLLVGFSRWQVERCFEDQKDELGLDHYEGRCYAGLKRHLILSTVSDLFLSRVREELGEKNPGADRGPGPRRGGRSDRVLVA
jgi:SRSO17 transposase